MYDTQTEIKCPYFKRRDKLKIVCEGFDQGFNTVLEFPGVRKRGAYIQKYCSSIKGCTGCKLHQLLDEKWGVSNTNVKTL